MSSAAGGATAKEFYSVKIKNSLLIVWHKSISKKNTYIDLLNESLQLTCPIQVTAAAARVEGRLRRRAAEVASKSKRLSKGKRQLFLKSTSLFTLWRDEFVNPHQLQQELDHMSDSLDTIRTSLERSKRQTLALQQLIASPPIINYGKGIDEVSERQRRRKVATLKEGCEKSLNSFVESYNAEVMAVSLKTKSTNETLCLNITTTTPSTSQSTSSSSSSHQVLYLLDRFGVSDQFYHELAMAIPSLPRSYKVKQVRSSLSSELELNRLPSPYSGCYRCLTEAISGVVGKEITKGTTLTPPIGVKITGDGAPISRVSSVILLSFSLPYINDLSSDSVHTFAAIEGEESYENLKKGFKPVLEEINSLLLNPIITVGSQTYPLKIYFGGDYKFLLLMMGLNKANSTYACLYCHVPSDKRWNVSINHTKRTLTSIHQCLGDKVSYGCQNPPLINIDPSYVVLDELHLMLRIFDILIRNLIWGALAQDIRSRHEGSPAICLDKLIEAIRQCGITFHVWQAKEGTSRSKDNYCWTSLCGNDRRALLKRLPQSFKNFLPPATCSQVQQLWEEFNLILTMIGLRNPTDDNIDILEKKAVAWVNLFVSIPMEGHQKKNVTPYIHMMAKHCPVQMRTHGGIKRFSGQGTEKNNDDARRNYFSSNHHDITWEILTTEARLEALEEYKREKRKYNKSDDNYWTKEIFNTRKR